MKLPNKSKQPIVVYTSKVPVTVDAKHLAEEIRRAINMSIVGETDVNECGKDGIIVPKSYPKNKLKILKEAHHRIMASRTQQIEFDITDHGEFINFRIPK